MEAFMVATSSSSWSPVETKLSIATRVHHVPVPYLVHIAKNSSYSNGFDSIRASRKGWRSELHRTICQQTRKLASIVDQLGCRSGPIQCDVALYVTDSRTEGRRSGTKSQTVCNAGVQRGRNE
jgi:hypothetical protein